MDYFNKEEFQQLKNLPRSAQQKSETMDRIRSSSSKQPQNYPMKYVFTSFAVILLAVILIVPELFSTKQQAIEPTEVTPNVPSNIEPNEEDNPDDGITSDSILNALEIGMSEEEVKQILGNYYSKGETTISYENGESIRRYEIEKVDEYKYEVEGEVSKNYLEFEAMNNENIKMVVLIHWDTKNLVKQYSAIYKDVTDSKIYHNRVLQNGTLLKEPIYPPQNVNTENILIDIELLKTEIKNGMTMEEVKNILGNHYITTVNVDDSTLSWNYDYGKKPDFEFMDKLGFVDSKAFEEMIKGKIQAHIGIKWDKSNLVSSFYGVYMKENENRVYLYQVFSNGQFEDGILYSIKNSEIN